MLNEEPANSVPGDKITNTPKNNFLEFVHGHQISSQFIQRYVAEPDFISMSYINSNYISD
jgi:hypothetical protein